MTDTVEQVTFKQTYLENHDIKAYFNFDVGYVPLSVIHEGLGYFGMCSKFYLICPGWF